MKIVCVVLVVLLFLVICFEKAQAQEPKSLDAALEDALWICLRGKYPGTERDAGDHTRAFNPETGQNFVYDKDKQAWIDAKTGECICPKCPPTAVKLEDALWICLRGKYPGTERDAGDHTRAFNPETGQNFVYDKDKQAWIDAKTGECICPKCPPTAVKLEDALWICLRGKYPGTERDAGDHTRAFNPETGQNFVYDKDKKAWIDAKTGECICPKCPPAEHAKKPSLLDQILGHVSIGVGVGGADRGSHEPRQGSGNNTPPPSSRDN